LKRILEAVDLDGDLELVVVDTDGCPDLYELPGFGCILSGAGEAAWIRGGQVVRTSGRGYHPELFEPFTRQLLMECMTERGR
jgi:hypothetical protein